MLRLATWKWAVPLLGTGLFAAYVMNQRAKGDQEQPTEAAHVSGGELTGDTVTEPIGRPPKVDIVHAGTPGVVVVGVATAPSSASAATPLNVSPPKLETVAIGDPTPDSTIDCYNNAFFNQTESVWVNNTQYTYKQLLKHLRAAECDATFKQKVLEKLIIMDDSQKGMVNRHLKEADLSRITTLQNACSPKVDA